MLEFIVNEQLLQRADNTSPATDSIDYLKAKFTFKSNDWDGAEKKAIFTSHSGTYDAVLDSSGVCIVPWEILTREESILNAERTIVTVTLAGTKGGQRITTNDITVSLNNSGYKESESSKEPTPSAYEQFVSRVEATAAATAQNAADVAEAEERIKNSYANTLKGNASGEVVRVDDVSPIEHTAKVTVHGKNLWNNFAFQVADANNSMYISNVTSNAITLTSVEGYVGNGHHPTPIRLRQACPQMRANKTYVLQANSISNIQSIYLTEAKQYWNFNAPLMITEELLDCTIGIYGLSSMREQGVGDCVISNIQIEAGDTATEYEPYIDPSAVTVTEETTGKRYTPDANGNVDVTSVSPTMTLVTDTDGVTIDLEYNRDLNANMGDIVKALDSIIAIQEALIGGDSE